MRIPSRISMGAQGQKSAAQVAPNPPNLQGPRPTFRSSPSWKAGFPLGIAPFQGGVLHGVSEVRFRWVGWSIAAATLVLALTFMSNRPLGEGRC